MTPVPHRLDRPWTDEPALVEVYDVECAGRADHDFYLAVQADLDASSVVDVGCGTGVFSLDIARRGIASIGVDPSAAMIQAAQSKPDAHLVDWQHGTTDVVASSSAELVVMMGHVAQYFVDDASWENNLRTICRSLVPGGRVAFEVRNPANDWAARWTRERTETVYDHPAGGTFRSWVDVVDKVGPAHSYAMTHEGHTVLPDGRWLVATETLRFRSFDQVRSSLRTAGFEIEAEWGDWDQAPVSPQCPELIVVARRR
jgi:SAM-dependent methyltransferase